MPDLVLVEQIAQIQLQADRLQLASEIDRLREKCTHFQLSWKEYDFSRKNHGLSKNLKNTRHLYRKIIIFAKMTKFRRKYGGFSNFMRLKMEFSPRPLCHATALH